MHRPQNIYEAHAETMSPCSLKELSQGNLRQGTRLQTLPSHI